MLPLTVGKLFILVYLVNTVASVLTFFHFVVLVQPAAMFQVCLNVCCALRPN
jgi:hypothetical protein